jgi:hypothetical protein
MNKDKINYYLTIGGEGLRMKCISPKDKYLLYWRDKRIIDWIIEIIPTVKIVGFEKTRSRKETLNQITEKKNICIIDCDIIPFGLPKIEFYGDTVICFNSDKNKYSSVKTINDVIYDVSEHTNISQTKCSGVYFFEDIDKLLNNMTDENSIVSGMIGSKILYENTFIKLGDVEDYFESL